MKSLWATIQSILLRRPSALPADPFGGPSPEPSTQADPFFEGVKSAAWSPAGPL